MPWPFRRKARDAEPGAARPAVEAPPATPAETAVLEAAREWWRTARRDVEVELHPATSSLQVTARGGNADGAVPGVVVVARRGKLARVDVHDPSLRREVDAMVRHFEALGKWSFNGVVRSLAADTGAVPEG